MSCVRSITFDIPGKAGAPGIRIYVEESAGTLMFTVNVLGAGGGLPGDLRGLFFDLNDDSKLAGLAATGSSKITGFDTHDVIDLGNGVNMQGAASPFDVGIKFGTPGKAKDDIQSVSFTLSNSAGNLTLDDIAHAEFGARTTSTGAKLTTIAPAAPNAVNDAYNIFEDGQSGPNDPSTVPEGVLFAVLANDTDADGNTLTITSAFGALHGTVQIVDGADADSLAGDAILYTPFEDYAGTDSFTYCITDNNGGTDFAEVSVSIAAVADVPDITVQVLAGNAVNEIKLIVTAAQTDADSSEFIDKILTSSLPAGVTITPGSVDPGTEPDQIVQEFLLTLPAGQDSNFDLTFTAVSKETSNGDTQDNSVTVEIAFEYNENNYSPTFLAADQSIWDSGDQFTFTDNRFIGVDTVFGPSSAGGLIGYDFYAALKAGFQSKLTFEGGEIDATLDYDLGIDTTYNKTTDSLLISTSQLLTGGDFTTEGPEGHYKLDFIFNYYIDAALTYDIGVASGDIVRFTNGNNLTQNILDLDSSELAISIGFPPPFSSVSASLAWPNIATDAVPTPPPSGEFSADGASNNFLQVNLDVDQALADIFLGGINPFNIPFDLVVVWGNIELLDLDVFGGLNFLQSFVMQEQGFQATLHFEDGSSQAFTFGSDILLTNASAIDQAGDGDGDVEFYFKLDPQASLDNDTDLGFNVGYNFDLLKVSGEYTVLVDTIPFTVGPAFHAGGTLPLGSVDIYDNTFDLDFMSQSFSAFA
jgi:Bacterial Ig domain